MVRDLPLSLYTQLNGQTTHALQSGRNFPVAVIIVEWKTLVTFHFKNVLQRIVREFYFTKFLEFRT